MLFVSAMSFPVFVDGLAESYFEGEAFARKGGGGGGGAEEVGDQRRDCGRVDAGRSEPCPYKGEEGAWGQGDRVARRTKARMGLRPWGSTYCARTRAKTGTAVPCPYEVMCEF
jgi:hypothetical protein